MIANLAYFVLVEPFIHELQRAVGINSKRFVRANKAAAPRARGNERHLFYGHLVPALIVMHDHLRNGIVCRKADLRGERRQHFGDNSHRRDVPQHKLWREDADRRLFKKHSVARRSMFALSVDGHRVSSLCCTIRRRAQRSVDGVGHSFLPHRLVRYGCSITGAGRQHICLT